MKGCVQIYTGDGKGKTTAALGLTLRAAGYGRRVHILQFLKGRLCGEHRALAAFPTVSLERVEAGAKFFWKLTDGEKADLRRRARAALGKAAGELAAGKYDLLILDEALGALHGGLLDIDDILSLLDCRPESAEVVLTGRAAPQALIDRADLVTEMVPIKHYFDTGLPAREGIEY